MTRYAAELAKIAPTNRPAASGEPGAQASVTTHETRAGRAGADPSGRPWILSRDIRRGCSSYASRRDRGTGRSDVRWTRSPAPSSAPRSTDPGRTYPGRRLIRLHDPAGPVRFPPPSSHRDADAAGVPVAEPRLDRLMTAMTGWAALVFPIWWHYWPGRVHPVG